MRVDFIEATRQIKQKLPACARVGRRLQPVVLLPRQRGGARRPCTRCSCTTPSRPAWTWASSTPASSRSTTTSTGAARAVEDVILNRRPDATERLVELAATLQGRGRPKAKEKDLAWRNVPVEERLKHALVHGITDYIEADTEEARASVDKPIARHRRPADGRHERGRRPVRRGQDVPAAGGEVGARHEAGGGLPAALHGGREEGRRAATRCRPPARS